MGDLTTEIQVFDFADVEIDVSRNRLTVAGEERHLRQKAFQVLVYLVANRQRVISKTELFETIWSGTAVTDDVLVQCVKEIRRALNDDRRDPRFIKTIYKSGYRFVWKVTGRQLALSRRPKVRSSSHAHQPCRQTLTDTSIVNRGSL